MATYLVRTIDLHKLIGVFVARDMEELCILLDEEVDPGLCEYIRIKNGAGVFMDGIIVLADEQDIPPTVGLEEGDEWEFDPDVLPDPDNPNGSDYVIRLSEKLATPFQKTEWKNVGFYSDHVR